MYSHEVVTPKAAADKKATGSNPFFGSYFAITNPNRTKADQLASEIKPSDLRLRGASSKGARSRVIAS